MTVVAVSLGLILRRGDHLFAPGLDPLPVCGRQLQLRAEPETEIARDIEMRKEVLILEDYRDGTRAGGKRGPVASRNTPSSYCSSRS